MEPAEASRMRREILDDIGALLKDQLAADEWGRLLVEVQRGPDGEPSVTDIDVEEIVGDEARVEAVFGGKGMRPVLPVLAKAAEALCGLDGLELDDVRGGTFVRLGDEGFAWLPALVHAPSVSFDRDRDAVLAGLRAKNDRLGAQFGITREASHEADLARGTIVFTPRGRPAVRAQATLVGTFAPATRTWGWGGSNPHVPEPIRRASSELADAVADRDMWEVSTPVFATDESTAWALAALVCDRLHGDGIFCGPETDGLVFLLLRDVAPC
jgi:hypothetical protein